MGFKLKTLIYELSNFSDLGKNLNSRDYAFSSKCGNLSVLPKVEYLNLDI